LPCINPQPKYKYDPTCGKGYDAGGYECYGSDCEELGFERSPIPHFDADANAPRAVLRDHAEPAPAAAETEGPAAKTEEPAAKTEERAAEGDDVTHDAAEDARGVHS